MADEIKEQGGISVDTEHIFPVIKRWLYSDKEIFLRELVSNGCDAITKCRRLESLGKLDAGDEPYRVDVTADEKLSLIRVEDNGIGMTADEIKKYINQIALSGALEFIEKYEGESGEGNGIIGHFGLGFYSAFMVAGRVDINTLSFEEGAESAFWTCTDAGEFEMKKGTRKTRGTEIVLHVTEEEKDFLKKEKLLSILKKYCAFMNAPIYFHVTGENEEKEEPINDPHPLWLKNPSDCTEEEYKEFYHKVFSDPLDPLFWVHINAEFPLNFKGILYFPKLADEYASLEGQVKLFYNQVFVADNIKEVIPEYMMLLRGVLDCPELPLNVSRSYLQNSGYVTKISNHVTKKLCDKLTGLFKNDRKTLEGFWRDVKPFVEYGCTRDEKFFSRMKDSILYETSDGAFLTAEEYLKANEGKGAENTIYYANDKLQQVGYINLFREQGITVALLDGIIDPRFISFLEMQDHATHFIRVDSEMDKVLRSGDAAEDSEDLKNLFKEVVPEKVTVVQDMLKSAKVPALITLSEEKRRLGEILKQYGTSIPGIKAPEDEVTLVVNRSCPLIARIEKMAGDEKKKDKAKTLARQVYLIALVQQRSLSEEELSDFIDSSIELLYNA